MKKKLSIIPLLVVAFTMMFGTLCVWATTPIKKVDITLPDTCDGKDVKEFIESGISVAVYVNDDSPDPIDINNLKYKNSDDVQSYICTEDSGVLNPGTTMKKGKRYEFNLRITLADSVNYEFANDGDILFTGRVSSNKSIDVSEKKVPLDGRDIVIIKFYYTYGSSSSTPKKTVTLFPHEIYHPVVAVNEEKPVVVPVDRDTFKSEVPAKTVIASEMFDRKSFFDLKVHESDSNTKFNQEFLARCLVPGGGKTDFSYEGCISEKRFIDNREWYDSDHKLGQPS